MLGKESAILPKLIRLGATDIPHTPRLFMRGRSPMELRTLEKGVGNTLDKVITNPLERGLTALKTHKAVSQGANALSALSDASPVIPGTEKLRLMPSFGKNTQGRSAWADSVGKKVVRGIAENPIAALAPGGAALPVIDRMLGRMMPKYAQAFELSLTKIAAVSPYQQATQWSCSAACLKAVLAHYGTELSEDEAVLAVGAREGRGAEVTEISDAATSLGFDAFDYEFSSLDQANVLLQQDIPIICDIQSFNYEGKGHYVVLHKLDAHSAHLMDPNTPGNSRVIPLDHLEAMWWDHTMAKPHVLKQKWGVVILPPV